MTKKFIAILTVITILFICVFAACEKEDGIYIDNKEYDFVTDENGEKVLDKDGRFVVYEKDEKGKFVTNASGEKVTKVQPFEAMENDGVVEHYSYSIVLPDGWKSTDSPNKFENSSTKQNAQIDILEYSYDDYYNKSYDFYERVVLASKESEEKIDVSWEEELDIGTGFNKTYRFVCTSGENAVVVYVFENSGNLYKIIFNSPNVDTLIADSEALCHSMRFKPYKYHDETTSKAS